MPDMLRPERPERPAPARAGHGPRKEKFGIEVHSCLMGTHPHLMCRSARGQQAFSSFWKLVNWGFARWSNRRTNGRGQVVMERLRSPRIQDGRHQLTVMRYGDLNPVRAGLVESAGDWKWSSHRHYAYGEPNNLITDAPEYLALGRTNPERRKAYLHLFAHSLLGELLTRRTDLVTVPFIGSGRWLARRLRAVAASNANRRSRLSLSLAAARRSRGPGTRSLT